MTFDKSILTGFTLEEAVDFSYEMCYDDDDICAYKKLKPYHENDLYILIAFDVEDYCTYPLFIFRYNEDTQLYDFRGVDGAVYTWYLYEKME